MQKLLWAVVLAQSVAIFLLWAWTDRKSYTIDESALQLVVYIDRIESIERDLYGRPRDEGPQLTRPVTEDW